MNVDGCGWVCGVEGVEGTAAARSGMVDLGLGCWMIGCTVHGACIACVAWKGRSVDLGFWVWYRVGCGVGCWVLGLVLGWVLGDMYRIIFYLRPLSSGPGTS
ncbi:hypothetical protein BZA05DRAFT_382345 [Tricharina praecox]|uniref:uncharacterized protein n=1 Tax=Tricharina praecox TaxID=43433 RepID=UPI00221EEACA|nr:uncharacterized protein BZA05DRAFT_382345 [Tricharina praecox]KAI5858755.1 hypothetical protein BZA05DRAFT_382345 [Tricharina praecox]